MIKNIELSVREIEVLKHALGLNYRKSTDRNFYCTEVDNLKCVSLVKKGMMIGPRHVGKMIPADMGYFYVTDLGVETITKIVGE